MQDLHEKHGRERDEALAWRDEARAWADGLEALRRDVDARIAALTAHVRAVEAHVATLEAAEAALGASAPDEPEEARLTREHWRLGDAHRAEQAARSALLARLRGPHQGG